jgi:hypothetical protein
MPRSDPIASLSQLPAAGPASAGLRPAAQEVRRSSRFLAGLFDRQLTTRPGFPHSQVERRRGRRLHGLPGRMPLVRPHSSRLPFLSSSQPRADDLFFLLSRSCCCAEELCCDMLF